MKHIVGVLMRVCVFVCVWAACVDFFRFVLKSLERSPEKKELKGNKEGKGKKSKREGGEAGCINV